VRIKTLIYAFIWRIYRVVAPKRAKRIKESVDWYRQIVRDGQMEELGHMPALKRLIKEDPHFLPKQWAEYQQGLRKEEEVKKEKDLKSRINTLVKQETDV